MSPSPTFRTVCIRLARAAIASPFHQIHSYHKQPRCPAFRVTKISTVLNRALPSNGRFEPRLPRIDLSDPFPHILSTWIPLSHLSVATSCSSQRPGPAVDATTPQ